MLVAVANELYAIFAEAERGDSVYAAINAILDRARPWPRAISSGAGFAVADVDDGLSAVCALVLLAWVDARGTQRIGVCDGLQCVEVLADVSAAGSKGVTAPPAQIVTRYRARQRERTDGPIIRTRPIAVLGARQAPERSPPDRRTRPPRYARPA